MPINQMVRNSDEGGNSFVPLGLFGEVMTAEFEIEAAITGRYGVNTNIVTTSACANGGTVDSDNSRLRAISGTASNGVGEFRSYYPALYIPGLMERMIFTAVWDTPIASNKMLCGLTNGSDEIIAGYDGTSFVFGRKRSGDSGYTVTEWSEFNGDKPNVSMARGQINFAYGNIFGIDFQWLGYGPIVFWMKDPTKYNAGYKILHAIEYTNTSAIPHVLNPSFNMFARSINAGNTTTKRLASPSMFVGPLGRKGGKLSNPLHFHRGVTASASISTATETHLLSVRNDSTWPGAAANVSPITIHSADISRLASGAASTVVNLYKNVTAASGFTYTPVNATNSPTEYSTTASTSTAGGELIMPIIVTQDDVSREKEFTVKQVYLNPGETVSAYVVNSGAQATTVYCTMHVIDMLG